MIGFIGGILCIVEKSPPVFTTPGGTPFVYDTGCKEGQLGHDARARFLGRPLFSEHVVCLWYMRL